MSESTIFSSKKNRPEIPPLKLSLIKEEDYLIDMSSLKRPSDKKSLFGSIPEKDDNSDKYQSTKNSKEKIWGSGVLGQSYSFGK